VAAVVSNKADAKGLVLAREQGIATQVLDHKAYATREAFDAALAQAIDAYEPALVVLAGFMRILTPGFVDHFAGPADQHPPLAAAGFYRPAHAPARHRCGLQVCRLHRAQVTAELDVGPILGRPWCRAAGHGRELAARVLTQEHLIYPGCWRIAFKNIAVGA
jgi:phosphoribosylglycinamide formyltransferase-1